MSLFSTNTTASSRIGTPRGISNSSSSSNSRTSSRTNNQRHHHRYRSSRGVKVRHNSRYNDGSINGWIIIKGGLVCCGASFLGIALMSPLWMISENMIEKSTQQGGGGGGGLQQFHPTHHGLASIMDQSKQLRENWHLWGSDSNYGHDYLNKPPIHHEDFEDQHEDQKQNWVADKVKNIEEELINEENEPQLQKKISRQRNANSEQEELEDVAESSVDDDDGDTLLARGIAGMRMSQTPALIGAKRATLECNNDENVDYLTYWNQPQGTRDLNFVSPFIYSSPDEAAKNAKKTKKKKSIISPQKYITFQLDSGGWNNIRITIENIFVIALATGRTIVLPPDTPMYLLGTGKENAKSISTFYNITKINKTHPTINIITMEQFITSKDGQSILNLSKKHNDIENDKLELLKSVSKLCTHRSIKEDKHSSCDILYKEYLQKYGYQPHIYANRNKGKGKKIDEQHCFIFDRKTFYNSFDEEYDYSTNEEGDNVEERVKKICGLNRMPVYYTKELYDPPLIHWNTWDEKYRLINHYYTFIYFTDQAIDNYYKRFVRDYLHYNDYVFCLAGKIINAIQKQEYDNKVNNPNGQREISINNHNGTSTSLYSSIHVRHGDLQYKEVLLSGELLYENTKEVWNPNELLYVATDEHNMTFFEPLTKYQNKQKHRITYLNKYKHMLPSDIDTSLLGLIDTIIASHGRTFVGTWHSTFTGYINRMRGYNGLSSKTSYYSYLPRKYWQHTWTYPDDSKGIDFIAGEYPIGWIGIDSDKLMEEEQGIPPNQKDEYINTTNEYILARGTSGLPISKTPALIGAERAKIRCDDNNGKDLPMKTFDRLLYWNDPQGKRDINFKSPFANSDAGKEKFLTFEPDPGGWNNIRMNLENMFVLAAATGRTLVLPPSKPMYLLGMGEEGARHFADFYDMDKIKKRIKVITMKEFIQKHGKTILGLSADEENELLPIANMCVFRKDSKNCCDPLEEKLRSVGYQPKMVGSDHCFIFDKNVFDNNLEGTSIPKDVIKQVKRFCGEDREPRYYNKELHDPTLIHWNGADLTYRVLQHFYAFFLFTDPAIDNHYKRFVRDFLHYDDDLYCTAGIIVNELQKFDTYSTLHVRRGDLQFHEVKISAEEWYENSKELWEPNEVLYIATDEQNKTFFDPIRKHHRIKFLDDYWDIANLGDVDQSHIGMIETIIASTGRTFVGTWHSTFSGYIQRLRGYQGYSSYESLYSYLPRKRKTQGWEYPSGNYAAREFPIGWVGIDGDKVLEQEQPLPPSKQYVSSSSSNSSSGHRANTGSGGGSNNKKFNEKKKKVKAVKKEKRIPSLSELAEDDDINKQDLARGVAGLSWSETPALKGAKRGHIECDINVDSMAYWNAPQGKKDESFESPFSVTSETSKERTKYISFTPDRGGWNNIRMSMEIIFVIASVTGRTLVLPPPQNLYLLVKDKKKKHRGFADFFPLKTSEFQKRVPIISMEEFIEREMNGGILSSTMPSGKNRTRIVKSSKNCVMMKKKDNFCGVINDYLTTVGHTPSFRAQDGCVVFDEKVYETSDESSIESTKKRQVEQFCGEKRKVFFWRKDEMDEPPLIHFRGGEKKFRLLTHFYSMLYFTNPSIDNHYKRFVRDYLHYQDTIYCAAGKIVKAIQAEGVERGFTVNDDGSGAYSSMHIRRGDFQYKKVKLPAQEWYDNTAEIWQPNEILYIATDERNKTWFNPIANHHDIRFLDDYWDMAGLSDIDPNFMGMIDTIVASRSRAFAGTWFSTFSGYINRMRGYHGLTMQDSWYSFLDRKTAVHTWRNDSQFAYAYEWPTGWIGIDGEKYASRDRF